jgi:citrate lyase beta subunit
MRLRSVLFAPADDERKLRRALEAGADAVIADLEDAVAAERKGAARATLQEAWGEAPRGEGTRYVRVNEAPELLLRDLAVVECLDVDGVVVPKATVASVRALGGRHAIAVVESAAGLLEAAELARLGGVVALLFGTVDLALDLGLEPPADERALLAPGSTLVVASAAARIAAPIDGVHLALDDEAGLAERARTARSLGFGGKACIHPRQVPIVNEVFAPTEAELERARAIVAAYDAAVADGTGAIRHEGAMIDLPVAERARRLLRLGDS